MDSNIGDPREASASRLTGYCLSLALGVGLVLGWKLRKWTGGGQHVKWTQYLTPRYKLVLVVRGDIPNWNRTKLAEHCASASVCPY